MTLSPKQNLILWALLVKPGFGALQKDIRPKLDKRDRDALVKPGLASAGKRGRSVWIEVTDKGWAWAGENLDGQLPSRSTEGAAILQTWLGRLKAFMDAHDFALADILAPRAAPTPVELSERVRRAYLEITGGRFNTRVLLSDLRGKLTDVDRATLDAALSKLHLRGDANLSGIDNPEEITPTIRNAGLDFKGALMLELWMAK